MSIIQDLIKIGKKELSHLPEGCHFALAIDGSQSSMRALTEMTQRIVQNSSHHLTIFHFFDNSKTYLPQSLHPDVVRKYAESCCSKLERTQVDFFWKERSTQHTTKEDVVNFVNSIIPQPDFLVIGFAGRKIDECHSNERRVLGSSADFSLRRANCSVILFKPIELSHSNTNGMSFLVCIDGAITSFRTLYDTLQIISNKRTDQLILLHIAPDQQASLPVQYRYEAIDDRMKEIKRMIKDISHENIIIRIERTNPQQTIAEQVVSVSEEMNVDFICVGADGMCAPTQQNFNKEYNVGSTSDAIIKISHRNVLVSHHTPIY